MTDHSNAPVLTLRSPDDVLAMVATVFGFHPTESLVLVTRTDTASFHARVDLPSERSALPDLAEYLCEAAVRNGARQAALVAYSRDPQLSSAAVLALEERLLDAGVSVGLTIREHAGFWFHLGGRAGDIGGTPYDLQAHPLVLQSSFDDREIYSDRESLAASLRGSSDEIDRVDAQLDPAAELLLARTDRRPVLDAVRDYVAAETAWLEGRLELGVLLSDAEVARLCLAVSFVEIRDRAWSMIAPESARRWVETWKAIVRRVPETVVAPPASLLAFAAWLSGDGALAWCAIDLARRADPDYSLAGLLAQALESAVPPSAWTPPEEFTRHHKAG